MDKVKEINKKFFNLWAITYDWSLLKPWLYSLQKKATSNINLRNNLNILDVGCGTGDSLILLSKFKFKLNLYGLDLSEKMIKRARKKLNGKAILKIGDVENLPFKANSFDYVLNTEAFHHFPNPDKAVKEIYRILKKEGKLILADITFESLFIKRIFKLLEPGHVKIYTKKEFNDLFVKNKFKVLKQKKVGLFVILNIVKK